MILQNIKKRITLNFSTELVYALSLFVLLLVSFAVIVCKLGGDSPNVKTVSVYIVYLVSVVSITRLLKMVLNLFSPKLSSVYEIVVHVCVYVLSVVSIFLIVFFNTMFDYGVMQLINGTNGTECIEFLQTYVLTLPSLLVFFLFALFLTAEIFVRRWIRLRGKTPSALYLVIFIALSIPFAFYVKAFSGSAKGNFDFVNRTSEKLLTYDPIFAIQNTYLQFNAMSGISKVVADNQRNLTATCDDEEPTNIVLVIGESFNKYHSQLYGYVNATNPLLAKLQQDSSLFVFTDAVATYNRTATAIQNMMSTVAYTDTTDWYNGPLFPSIFRAAGYNVNFISNSFALSGLTTYYRSEAFYLCDGVVSKQIFNYQNSHVTKYDHELIDNYRQVRNDLEKESNLVIFQLMGQHVDASKRFPPEFGKFSVSDIKRPKLTEAEKQYIANYDNATYYNDKVINDIIEMYSGTSSVVVYLSDHGDEVYDVRNKVGRSYNVSASEKEILHCQIDVPMVVYVSPKFKEKHPDKVEKIKSAVDKKFTADGLPHMLLDLGSVSTPFYDEKQDVLSEKYSKNRRVLDGLDYDKIMGDGKFGISYGF